MNLKELNSDLFYYLMSWKDTHQESYYRFYKEKRIIELNKVEIKELIRLVSIHETYDIDKSDLVPISNKDRNIGIIGVVSHGVALSSVSNRLNKGFEVPRGIIIVDDKGQDRLLNPFNSKAEPLILSNPYPIDRYEEKPMNRRERRKKKRRGNI